MTWDHEGDNPGEEDVYGQKTDGPGVSYVDVEHWNLHLRSDLGVIWLVIGRRGHANIGVMFGEAEVSILTISEGENKKRVAQWCHFYRSQNIRQSNVHAWVKYFDEGAGMSRPH